MEVLFAVVFAAIGVSLIVILGSLLEGWVLTVLWKWFIVPIFDLPPLPIIVAVGIGLMVAIITPKIHPKNEQSLKNRIANIFLFPLFVLFIGWIFHFFV